MFFCPKMKNFTFGFMVFFYEKKNIENLQIKIIFKKLIFTSFGKKCENV